MVKTKSSIQKDDVLSFFFSVGINASKNQQQFWNRLIQNHGKKTVDNIGKILDARADEMESKGGDLYQAKNEYLALSLDFSAFSADMYRRFFEWIVKRGGEAPQRILDIGCDNGIVSCFMAQFYPDAEVVGIDTSNNGIRCAQELANKLKLTNVKFEKLSFFDAKNRFDPKGFDLIVSLRSLVEIIGSFPPKKYWSMYECLNDSTLTGKYSAISIVGSLLADDGEFITAERLPGLGPVMLWANSLEHSGLFIDWSSSDILRFHEVGEKEEFPILVATKRDKHIEIIDGIIDLYMKDSMTCIGEIYNGSKVELLFHKEQPKEFIRGLQIDYHDGSGKMRLELWDTHRALLLYKYTNTNYRELSLWDKENVAEAIGQLETIRAEAASVGKIYLYDTLSERPI